MSRTNAGAEQLIPLTLTGGYLGAGKTSLLNRILAQNHGRRLALLINDFGTINIDADLIESRTEQQISLTSGCICCSLADGFHAALEKLLAAVPLPEHLLVEASGVADVGSLAGYGNSPGFQLDGILVLADAETVMEKARDRYLGTTVMRQLQAADLLLLNKLDLVDAKREAEILTWLAQQFPLAPVIKTRNLHKKHTELPLHLLFGLHQGPHEKNRAEADPAHARHASWQLVSHKTSDRERLGRFLAALPAWVLRLKGFVQLDGDTALSVQVVGKRKEVKPAGKPVRGTRLVALGADCGFSRASLDRLAEALFKKT